MKFRRTLLQGLLVVLGTSTYAFADDDLMSILGTGSSSAPNANRPGTAQKENPFLKLLSQPTEEQIQILNLIDRGENESAFFRWNSGFGSTDFAKSPTGQALSGYLAFQNGLELQGIESLFAIEKPEAIDSEVLRMWREAAPDSSAIWGLASITWKPKWTEVFGSAAEVRVRGRQVYTVDQIEEIKDVVKKASVGTRERAWLEWQLVLALSMKDDAATAAKVLNHLMTLQQNPIGMDLMNLTAARLLFQNGYLDASIKYYEKVGKDSDYWLDSQEEVAWAHIRKGLPQNSLAITKTLVNPLFANQVGPEPVFLRALSQLKVCDYPGAVESLNLFRDRFRPRAKTLLEITENPNTSAVSRFIAKNKERAVKLTELGRDANLLPRFVTRDQTLLLQIQIEKQMEAELVKASALKAKAQKMGLLPADVKDVVAVDFKTVTEDRTRLAKEAALARVKALAQDELNEVSKLLQRMHIVETEVLQQISVAGRADKAQVPRTQLTGTTGSQARDRLIFPVEKEVWIDELANYKVDVKKACHTVKR